MVEVFHLTEQLKQVIDQLHDIFFREEDAPSIHDKDFFLKMKEETAPIYTLLSEWEETCLAEVKLRNVQVHPHQIHATAENIELLILHSYYKDLRKRRYMEYYNSSHYVCNQILDGENQ
ncbi:MAG TPA: DUF1798 family protein [Bacillota bacterium]|nr:DUF1798 family protein [Bacillota bacterium]